LLKGRIEALGGAGDMSGHGGGGSGGRVAVYHQSNDSDLPYLGRFLAFGGAVGQYAEAGGAGTAYVKNEREPKATLIVDNNGQRPVDSFMHNIGYRLDFSTAGNIGKASSFKARAGSSRTVSTSVRPYNRGYSRYCSNYPLPNHASYYLLSHMFDQTMSSSRNRIFVADKQTTVVTLNLGQRYNINRIRVFPACDFPSRFRVTLGVNKQAGEEIPSSRFYNHNGNQGYIEPASNCAIGSFTDVVVGHLPADSITIEIQGLRAFCHQYFASLSEVEVYAGGQSEKERYLHRQLQVSSLVATSNAVIIL